MIERTNFYSNQNELLIKNFKCNFIHSTSIHGYFNVPSTGYVSFSRKLKCHAIGYLYFGRLEQEKPIIGYSVYSNNTKLLSNVK